MITQEIWGKLSHDAETSGLKARLFRMSSSHSRLKLVLSDFGARVVSISVKGPDGSMRPLTATLSRLEDYETQPGYLGAVVGRFGNRIASGRFSLGGKEYVLFCNNGQNHLHGGRLGFDRKIYSAELNDDNQYPSITFSAFSPDGEEGYPGNLEFSVKYSLVGDCGFRIDYKATSDADTPLNLTNHTYFNLNGCGNVESHVITTEASAFLPVDKGLIPTGEIRAVEGTPFDFRRGRRIADAVYADDEQVRIAKGVDHCFVFPGPDGFRERLSVYSPESGVKLRMLTDRPAVQIYSGNFMEEIEPALASGEKASARSAFCLETEGFPDAPNHKEFPDCVLKAGARFESSTAYIFEIPDQEGNNNDTQS